MEEKLIRNKWWATRLSRSRAEGLSEDVGAAGAEEGEYTVSSLKRKSAGSTIANSKREIRAETHHRI